MLMVFRLITLRDAEKHRDQQANVCNTTVANTFINSDQMCKSLTPSRPSQSKPPLASFLPRNAVVVGAWEGHWPLLVLVLILGRGRRITAASGRSRAGAVILAITVERVVLLERVARVATHSATTDPGI